MTLNWSPYIVYSVLLNITDLIKIYCKLIDDRVSIFKITNIRRFYNFGNHENLFMKSKREAELNEILAKAMNI